MRRTRARLLAAAVVITTAGIASASLDLVVAGVRPGMFAGSAGPDGGTSIDDAILAGSDAPMEGGVDAGSGSGSGSDAGMDAGSDAGSGSGSDASTSPLLDVQPASLAFGMLPVDQTAAQMIQISNIGSGLLDNIVIDFGATSNASQWLASACTASAPCQLGTGQSTFVSITFAPTTHGVKDVTATVTSNGGTDTVALLGTGTGGVMAVQTPAAPDYILDIGTIPRGQPFSRDIVLENLGNATYTATTSTPTAPYTIAAGPVAVGAGSAAPISVTCQSATATATDNPQTITITSNAYLGSPASVDVRCKVADTTLQIMPTTFDFGEVRIGTPEPGIDITLTNPASSAGDAHVNAFDLRLHTPGLALTKPAVPFAIAPGATQLATLKLSTAKDADLTGEYLDLTVDGTQLQFPVSGKVVTPHSRVVPPNQLDLGTACVGTDISGTIMLINDGTATLAVQAPEMDQSFLAAAPGAPGTLAAGKTLTAMVTPSSTAMGKINGTLTWRDDVPSDHQIGVLLDYVSTGTALSPRGLDFGVVPVGLDVGPQHIKLQNCDQSATKIKILSLKTKAGPLGAWIIEPRVGYEKQLAAKEEQAITVTFEPPARGRYEADLTVQTAGGKQIVHLVGDASGRDFDRTSFYACACNGPGAPTGGLPIVAAVVIVIGRRRRGSSSAR